MVFFQDVGFHNVVRSRDPESGDKGVHYDVGLSNTLRPGCMQQTVVFIFNQNAVLGN